MEKRTEPEFITINGMLYCTEKVVENDNYMSQIDTVQAMKMKPNYSEEDYDPTGFNRTIMTAQIDEVSMAQREMKKDIDRKFNKVYKTQKDKWEKEHNNKS